MTTFQIEYVKARRSWIDSQFSGLNSMQRAAVLATDGPVLILAGAGSGKTTVLISRIVNLLRYGSASDSNLVPEYASDLDLSELVQGSEGADAAAELAPVPPWRILAITFTNKAADELKSRLAEMLGESARDIWACTFHSACVRMLRRDAEHLGYGSNFTIYDSSDSLNLMKRILKEQNLDEKSWPCRSILTEISRAKDAGVLPEEYAETARKTADIRRQRISVLYTEYNRRLFAANAMDFDDLILNSVLMLQRYEDCRAYWQNRFSYIMVDEYQDTNHMQYLLISLLAGSNRNLCVVGDDDQSIYRFRGATIENILSFEKQFPGCRTIRLEQNYRSTEHILDAANNVIRHNLGRKGKELWTSLGSGDAVKVLTARDENEEAYIVSNAILMNYSKGKHWQDHAILYRMNAQSSQMEFALKRAGIPYRVIGGARFFDRMEIKDLLSYLCVVADPQDELRLSRIINVPPRGIGEKSVETALQLARERGLSLFDVLEQADHFPELSRAAIRMRQFAGMIRDLQSNSEDIAVLYDLVLERTGYLSMLENAKDERDRDRADNVRELKTNILTYQKESGDVSLSGYLASIALYTDIDGLDADADCVLLMTIHSAKGLEFPVVYVIGMEEGLFPSLRAIGETEDMEEERRLCYVAFTRAKEQLVLTKSRQRMIFGRTSANLPSRFLKEAELLPDEPVEKQSHSSFIPAHPVHKREALRTPFSNHERLPVPNLSVGQRIQHKAFGEGTVIRMTPMGGDQLIEVEFTSYGKKKLMLNAVSSFIRIL